MEVNEKMRKIALFVLILLIAIPVVTLANVAVVSCTYTPIAGGMTLVVAVAVTTVLALRTTFCRIFAVFGFPGPPKSSVRLSNRRRIGAIVANSVHNRMNGKGNFTQDAAHLARPGPII